MISWLVADDEALLSSGLFPKPCDSCKAVLKKWASVLSDKLPWPAWCPAINGWSFFFFSRQNEPCLQLEATLHLRLHLEGVKDRYKLFQKKTPNLLWCLMNFGDCGWINRWLSKQPQSQLRVFFQRQRLDRDILNINYWNLLSDTLSSWEATNRRNMWCCVEQIASFLSALPGR